MCHMYRDVLGSLVHRVPRFDFVVVVVVVVVDVVWCARFACQLLTNSMDLIRVTATDEDALRFQLRDLERSVGRVFCLD